MTVSGTLSPDLTGVFYESGTANGRAKLLKDGGLGDAIQWNGTQYDIVDAYGSAKFRTTNAPASPDLGVWTGLFGTSGTPTVVDSLSEITAERDGDDVDVLAYGHGLETLWKTLPGSPFSTQIPVLLRISGFETAGKAVDINGLHLCLIDGERITFSISGSPAGTESYVGPGTLEEPAIDDTAVGSFLAACHFSDPGGVEAESALLAAGAVCKRVAIGTWAVSDIPYPSGYVAGGECTMLHAFDRVYLFCGGQRALEWRPKGRNVESSGYVSSTGVVTIAVKDHGLAAGDEVTVSDIGYVTTDPNGTHAVASVVDVDTITVVIATGGGDETYTAGTGKMVASGFTYVPGGPYTQPQTFSVTGGDIDVVDGLVTIAVVGNTTIKAGDFVTVRKNDVAALSAMTGETYQVVSSTSTELTFYAPVADYTAAGTDEFQLSGRFSVGGGFMKMPAPPWGVYFQRRLWIPYHYTNGGTVLSPTYTDRGTRDEIVASDVLDSDTYDQLEGQFRVTGGVSDYVVAMQPFYEDRMIVLNRNSLHVVNGTAGTLQDTQIRELTREVGCLARRSVVQYASVVFFLSDNGVYGVEFQDEYNLRGVKEPLSLKIQPLIDRINKNLAAESVGVYFDNRYWLAVPLDSTVGSNDATGNNAVLVFNTLNNAWESLDIYGGGEFLVKDFIIAQDGDRNSLFIVNQYGGLHEFGGSNGPVDVCATDFVGGTESFGVNYELRTRGYSFGNQSRKRFSRSQVVLESSDKNPSDVDFEFATEDPDSGVIDIGSVEDSIGTVLPTSEVGTFRHRLGNPRGIYGVLTIRANMDGSAPIGRPKVISVGVEGEIHNRQTISQT